MNQLTAKESEKFEIFQIKILEKTFATTIFLDFLFANCDFFHFHEMFFEAAPGERLKKHFSFPGLIRYLEHLIPSFNKSTDALLISCCAVLLSERFSSAE